MSENSAVVWTPESANLEQLCSILRSSMSSEHTERSTAMETLDSFKNQPEFLNYLCFVFLERSIQDDVIRATAGMLLKNTLLSLHNQGHAQPEIITEYIKSNIIKGLQDEEQNKLIKNISGIVITTIFSVYYTKVNRYDPQSLNTLSQLLTMVSESNNEYAIKALSNIMEDSAQYFTFEWYGNVKPLELLVPTFLEFMIADKTTPVIKAECIKSLNCIIPLQTQYFITNMDLFLNNIFQLASNTTNPDGRIREQICFAFTTLLDFRPEKLMDNLSGIIQFMLHLINDAHGKDGDDEDNNALEACDFLLTLSSSESIPANIIEPYINDIVPVLISHVCYDQEKILQIEACNDEPDCNIPDKDENIKPTIGVSMNKKNNTKKKSSTSDGQDGENEEQDDAEDEEDDEDYIWNLRKCSANTLECLTEILPKQVITIAFPLLRQHLTSEIWYVREATILTLSALSDGAVQYVKDQLPVMIPFLVEELSDPVYAIREIACWCIRRFSSWICNEQPQLLIPTLEPILESTIFDIKKSVQASAISCVATFMENMDDDMLSGLLSDTLLAKFNECFLKYQKKNLIILYDVVQVFVERCGLDEKDLNIIMPHLINKWSQLNDNDRELWPLLQCLSTVAAVMGENFFSMAPDVYGRCWRIIVNCLMLEERAQQDPRVEVPEKDLLVSALDLIDGLIQGLGELIGDSLVFNQSSNVLDILVKCLQDPVPEVRQSCFAIMGDLLLQYPTRLTGYLLKSHDEFFLKSCMLECKQDEYSLDSWGAISSMTNALWVLGLIVEREKELGAYSIELSNLLLDLYFGNIVQQSIKENVVVCIGKMAIYHPELFANSPQFVNTESIFSWLTVASELSDYEEKTATLLGFLKIMNLVQSANAGSIGSNVVTTKIVKKLVGAFVGQNEQENCETLDLSALRADILIFLMNNQQTVQQLSPQSIEYQFVQSLI
ncbi:hypothetical protein ACO0QE_001433 [Hanseniaspora vineae]